MGSSVSLIVPRWQYNDGPGNKFSNQVVRNRLKERLHSDNYAPYLVEAGQVNEAMREAIVSIAGDKQIENEMDVDTEIEECRTEIPKRRLTVELLVATLSRLRNQNILNFFSVVLSVIALGSCISVQFWAILCSLGVFFSRVWTIKLVREIGDEVALKRLPRASLNVGLSLTDNKAYFDKITFIRAPAVEGVADEPLKVNGYFFYTVNNIQVPLIMPRDDVIIEPGR